MKGKNLNKKATWAVFNVSVISVVGKLPTSLQ